MKLLFVFCCLSAAGCILWTEASPFFFNLQKNVQIQRQPVVRPQGFNFGFGGIISKWLPSIVVNKQFGTRRPKATQRPVIEVTTVFEPSGDLDKEDGTTTTTKLPLEVIDIFSETSSSSESPVDEAEVEVEENSSSTTTTTTKTEEPLEEVNNYTEEGTTSTTTALPFKEIEPFTESKTSTTTTELPFEETEPESNSSTNEGEGSDLLSSGIKTSTTTESTYEEIENNNENSASAAEGSQYLTDSKTSTTTTTELPFEGSSDASTTSNAESLINSIGFTTEDYTTSSSTEASEPSVEYLPSGSEDNGEIAVIKPTTYRPVFIPPATTTNAPWKETPANIANTGGFVDANQPIQSYVYVRPEISVDDILLNEVSPKARPFESISLVGTTSNGKRVERTYKPEPQPIGVINERPRVTFYSNY